MKIVDQDINNWFMHHPPTLEQELKYEELRKKFKFVAKAMRDLLPPCTDATAAFRKLREAMMAANLAIACNEEEEDG